MVTETLEPGQKAHLTLTWSSSPPQHPGYYWCRQPKGNAFIVQIKEGDSITDGYEWAGPLLPPEN